MWWTRTRTYQDIFAPRVGVIFDVECDEMLGEPTVESLVDLVEDEIEEIEAGNERRWEVDVTRNGEIDVVF